MLTPELVNNLAECYKLGKVIEFAKISIKSTNVMYKVETAHGLYCIKIINSKYYKVLYPGRTPDQILDITEFIANDFASHGIDTVAALKHDKDSYTKKINNNYFLVYPYLEHESFEIDPANPYIITCSCAKLTATLHNVHGLKLTKASLIYFEPEKWDELLAEETINEIGSLYMNLLGAIEHASLIKCLKQISSLKNKIKEWNELGLQAYNKSLESPALRPIHNDLHEDNILWCRNDENQLTPIIIDWESAVTGHPSTEMVCNALEYSGMFLGKLKPRVFKAYMDSYLDTLADPAIIDFKLGFNVWLVSRILACTGGNISKLLTGSQNNTKDDVISSGGMLKSMQNCLAFCAKYEPLLHRIFQSSIDYNLKDRVSEEPKVTDNINNSAKSFVSDLARERAANEEKQYTESSIKY